MTKRQRQSFADMVQAVQAAPPQQRRRRKPGRNPDGVFVDQDGYVFQAVAADIPPQRAADAVRDGARVVWDECGCGGACGMTWLSTADTRDLAGAGLPELPRRRRGHVAGSISEWRSDDGSERLLLVEGDVSWGSLFA